MKILILNGPNLNLLGKREPTLYGTQDYAALEEYLFACASELGCEIVVKQSNHEGVLVEEIQNALGVFDALIINAAAYTHTSIALLDALKAVALPAVEVHLTDLATREPFRQISYIGRACVKTVQGKGFTGYREAMAFLSGE